MSKPFEWYVKQYNMVGKSRRKAAYRFSNQLWESLMKYRISEIEEAVNAALKRPEVYLLKELSSDNHKLQCFDCQNSSWIGGAAMRSYECQNCRQTNIWGSTATPTLCTACAFSLFRCYRCGDDRSKDL